MNLRKVRNVAIALLLLSTMTILGCQALVRKMLFFPTHHAQAHGLADWMHEGKRIGFSRSVADPQAVWLMIHGNGGQASDRTYALPIFSEHDSVFILEYPGYGNREGKLSWPSFDAAASEAYELLRTQFPDKPVCVATESLGSGPGSTLARSKQPPDKFVFIVPFDDLKSLGRVHMPWLPTGLMLSGSWDNVESMKGYQGPVDVFAAERDEIIPPAHAKRLAESLPQARFTLIPGGHNDWSRQEAVAARKP